MILSLFLVPFLSCLAAFFIKSDKPRRALLVCAASAHALLAAAAAYLKPPAVLSGWLEIDAPALLFLGITSVLFLAASLYAVAAVDRAGRCRFSHDSI